jgi:ribonuclease Z
MKVRSGALVASWLVFTGVLLAGSARTSSAATESVSVPTAGAAGAITLTFLGTGAPRPSEKRSGPAILVEAGPHRFLIDAGSGTREQLFRARGWNLVTGLDRVFVTHLHYDHVVDLPDLSLTGWVYGRTVPLKVLGPAGTREMALHMNAAVRWDIDHRLLVGYSDAGSQIEATDVSPGVVFESDGLKVTAFEVEHMPVDLRTWKKLPFRGQTLGYRVDYKGRSVLFSGDTRSTPESEIMKFGRGVDVLVHEVQVPSPGASNEASLANVSLSVHTTPKQAGYVFAQTRPRLAVYSHIIPPQTTGEELARATAPFYDGQLLTAEDFMTITIGDEIVVRENVRGGESVFEKSGVVDYRMAPPADKPR